MVKNDFFRNLNHLLRELPKKERDEILVDFEEHFTIGSNEGKTEEEIIQELGDPKDIANAELADYYATNPARQGGATSATRSLLLAMVLIFFNLVVVAGPAFGIFFGFIGLWVGAICLVISPLLSLLSYFQSGFDAFLFTFFVSLACCGVGLLLSIALSYIGKFLWHACVGYVRFNMDLITGRKRS
ncbi:HAAS signaling domain-containing protein [Sporolactobacillus terrae]|uniref:DUF1700 domain-containing protein n=1 Tax=Sporolactobacillus terrae TaxID=269673 RepID=A0A410D7X6_9BACL|nr:DUF1700 domain-containing protein [Sporolactobacillus terrae]QAA22218.1 DUF1700 domain-containing protein [Sporolactobacillus terrae]QAA25192.1 DUF1700 domain-containing protein [Sporolactobacillus terrae]UAK17009.1 DUF1700 domain-containing protein [Sporolactobacillus terrae]BBN98529.1 hypothetical protein St703_12340 [Sporolactobacillus terrae]